MAVIILRGTSRGHVQNIVINKLCFVHVGRDVPRRINVAYEAIVRGASYLGQRPSNDQGRRGRGPGRAL